MPCGIGKTLVEYMLSTNYLNTIIITPLISTSEQTTKHFKNYYSNSEINFVEVNSNVGRDIKKYKFNKKNIIVSTYDSCDVINQIINKKKLTNILLIIDEFHNLSQNNLFTLTDEVNKLLSTVNINTLFVSATPKYFAGYQYGEVYKLSWKEAIDNKYICDYKFKFPCNEQIENEIELLKSNFNFVEKLILINKAYFLLKSVKEIGSKKCIIFLRTVKECEEFMKILYLVNEFVKLDIEVEKITHLTTKKARETRLTKFNTSDKIQFICNVCILDEGIDIPKCDTVYVTNPNNNIINLVQRISRCNRLDNDNADKIAHVLLWAKNETKIKKIKQFLEEFIDIKEDVVVCKQITPKHEIGKKQDVYMCEKCGKEFNRLYNYERHINSTKTCIFVQTQDEKIKNMTCDYCKRILASNTKQKRHMTICKYKPTVTTDLAQTIEGMQAQITKLTEIVKNKQNPTINITNQTTNLI